MREVMGKPGNVQVKRELAGDDALRPRGRARRPASVDACTALTEVQFRALEVLVVHAGQPVHTKDIAEHVTGGNYHADTTRRAIEGLVSAIGKSFEAAKKRPPNDLATLITIPRRGYYVLNAVGFAD